MKTIQRRAAAMLLAALATTAASAAWAHAVLKSASPASNAVVTAPPKEITLRFNEKLEAAFSTVQVLDASGKTVSSDKAVLDADNPAVMKITIPALAAGKYTVQYAVVGQDGHRRKGNYSFTVK